MECGGSDAALGFWAFGLLGFRAVARGSGSGCAPAGISGSLRAFVGPDGASGAGPGQSGVGATALPKGLRPVAGQSTCDHDTT